MKRALLQLGLILAFSLLTFLVGWGVAASGLAADELFITDTWVLDPAASPVQYGAGLALFVLLLWGGVRVGFALTGLLIRWGLLIAVVGLGLAGAGLFGATMALFGGSFGFDSGQRLGMALAAGAFGPLGLLMVVASLRDQLRARATQKKIEADPTRPARAQ